MFWVISIDNAEIFSEKFLPNLDFFENIGYIYGEVKIQTSERKEFT